MKLKLNVFSRLDRNMKVAILSGLLAALCAICFLTSVKSESAAQQKQLAEKFGGSQTEVCVAKRDIAAGETLKDTDVEVKQWVSSLLPENVATSKKDCVGKQLGSSILKGEVVCSARFQSQDSSISVPSGMVAVSIPLDDTSSVGGTLKVNQKVDIYATGSSTTSKICSNVQILETSNSDKSVDSETKWVTVAVEKDSAQEVVSAAQKLKLYVVLPSGEGGEEYASQTSSQKTSSSESSSKSSTKSTSSTQSSFGTDTLSGGEVNEK